MCPRSEQGHLAEMVAFQVVHCVQHEQMLFPVAIVSQVALSMPDTQNNNPQRCLICHANKWDI